MSDWGKLIKVAQNLTLLTLPPIFQNYYESQTLLFLPNFSSRRGVFVFCRRSAYGRSSVIPAGRGIYHFIERTHLCGLVVEAGNRAVGRMEHSGRHGAGVVGIREHGKQYSYRHGDDQFGIGHTGRGVVYYGVESSRSGFKLELDNEFLRDD